MLKGKKGASIISLALCAVALTLVTAALTIATNNSAMYRANEIAKKQVKVVENSAYTKVYRLSEVEQVARQAFANNYLSFYDKEVDLLGLEALVLGEMLETIPEKQLDNFRVIVTPDGVDVENR